MALRIAEHAGVSDVGRQRSANEDSLVVAPPVFGVADGMGGAKAGEVASALAAEALQEALDEREAAEAGLARLLQDANRRIYELAVSDEAHRGMGTTLTAATLTGDEVSLAHVGDSRAYLLREGELEQITRDHSLVAELERSGQITAEAAEHHPQRSIITRALGPEPDVEVDTYTVTGRDGDLFLICSDGLTSMVSDGELSSILRAAGSLQDAADSLVRAANQSGGKDNITVVLFRLADHEGETVAPADDETIAGQISAADVRAAADTPTEEHLDAAPADQTIVARPSAAPGALSAPRKRRGRGRAMLRAIVALLLVAAAAAGLYAISRQVWFLGTNDGGLVTLYRGVPYELPFGVELYREEHASGVPARAIPERRRQRVLDHEWRGREDAVDLLRTLEEGRLSG